MAGEQLRVSEGKDRGKRLSVDADLLIGREAPLQEGRLGDDPQISRRHAFISRGVDGQLKIEDLGSANGTFVNGERIDAQRPLRPGDVVRVGQTVLEVTDAAGAVPERSAPPTQVPEAVRTREAAEAGEELVVTAGADPGRRLTLHDELVIGRAVSGEGKLTGDREVSRRHARIARDAAGRLTVEDLGSANGTFVNGERIRGSQALRLGDVVRIGSTSFQLTEAGRAPAPAAAAAAPPRPAARPPAPPREPRPPAVPTPARESLISDLTLGSVFAGCRVEEIIGHGEMGVVYRADELALQRPVALKLILPQHSREKRFQERFRRESKVAAAIDHPNVIPIFDAGEENGVLFITMRLVEGTDLRSVIAAEGRVEPLRAARIVRQVGAALDAAHAAGILHRDVKPSNVLLARGDHAYLSDFGLAKPATSESGLTRQGSIVARAEYVAPEQVLNERVDARADIYALGCMLFESLTGEPPFARWTEGPAALAHVEAPPPSPLDLRPELPRELGDVVRRAMAKDPRERYPSAGDLGEAALVAAGGLRRARRMSVVATGEAALFTDEQVDEALAGAPQAEAPEAAVAGGADTTRWAIALGALAIVAVLMVLALQGLSSL
jgi:pSer/pThr/pTyr-binding forkhead associated (FHA) protein